MPIKDIAYVRYQAPDLDRMESFLIDFGLRRAARTGRTLYMRAGSGLHHAHITELGDSAKTLGFGLLAESEADLNVLADKLGIHVENNSEPGGGRCVRFNDPSGFQVEVLHGQETVEPQQHREPLEVNASIGRKRLGKVIRLKSQPSDVVRLGHVAVLTTNFAEAFGFYRDVLGMRTSDSYWAGVKENTIAAFMHCGLGETFTDHHTIALISSQDGSTRFDHAAFEVLDLDDLMQSSHYLKDKAYEHSWGIGRHIQGSQLFDYWRDPFGNKVEHWTDGDLVNDDTPVGHEPMNPTELHQWGPPLTPEFFK